MCTATQSGVQVLVIYLFICVYQKVCHRDIPGFQEPCGKLPIFAFTSSASLNTSMCPSFCTCVTIYIPRRGTASSKAVCTCGFDDSGIIPHLSKSFSWTCCLLEVQVGEETGLHSRPISFSNGDSFSHLVVLSDLTSAESGNRGTCWVLLKNSPLSSVPANCSSHEYRLLSVNMACLSNSLLRPLPVSPETPNGSRKHPTSHLSVPHYHCCVSLWPCTQGIA